MERAVKIQEHPARNPSRTAPPTPVEARIGPRIQQNLSERIVARIPAADPTPLELTAAYFRLLSGQQFGQGSSSPVKGQT